MKSSSDNQTSSVNNQLAEYRRRQAERFGNMEKSSDFSKSYVQESQDYSMHQTHNAMASSPEPIQEEPIVENNQYISDFELARQLQEEEERRYSQHMEGSHGSINREDYNEYNEGMNHQPSYTDDNIRRPDEYRQEQLIPDPHEEEMARQEFIRQQQILYSQYQNQVNNGQNINPRNDLERNLFEGDAPLLNRRSVNHVSLPFLGNVNREMCNCILLGFLFSVLITTMIMILIFAD